MTCRKDLSRPGRFWFRRRGLGKRLFTPEFKREQIGPVVRGEVTMAELSRELEVSPSLVRRWRRLMEEGSQTAVAADGEVVPAYKLKEAEQRIRELERALGRKTMENEILRAVQEEIKKDPATTARPRGELAPGGGDLSCRGPRYHRTDDERVAGQIRVVVKRCATYGHRRVTARVNRLFGTRYNRKRIRRVMQLYGLTLPKVNRRRGRAHTGRIMRDRSDERWCSDELVIPCWNGEVVHVAFVLDCHDREALAHVAAARPLLATDIQEPMQRAVTFWGATAAPADSVAQRQRQYLHRARDRVGSRAPPPPADPDTGLEPRVERHERSIR
jgi:transposase-like protein